MPLTPEHLSRIADIHISIDSYRQICHILAKIYRKNLIHQFAFHQLTHFFHYLHIYTNLPNFSEHYHYFLLPLLPQLEKPLPFRPIPLDSVRIRPTVRHTWSLQPAQKRLPNVLMDLIGM